MDITVQSGLSLAEQIRPNAKGAGPSVSSRKGQEPNRTPKAAGLIRENNDIVTISKEAKSVTENSNNKSSSPVILNNNRTSYSLTENNDLVIKIIDKNSNKVVRQIPQEEMIKIKQALLKALEQNSENEDL